MDLVEASTERTTAATDALIALAAIAAIVAIRRRTDPSFARAVWLSALGATAAASALGAVAHGIALRNGVRDLLWQPLYVALGAAMALFVVGAVNDWRGAGVVQASGVGPVRLVWTFDHNGLFHLVQLAGLTLLALGLRRLLASPVPETSG